MHWYGGSIAEAVTLSKQRNAIFVVFIEGDNDLSAEMAATIDDSDVIKRLSDEQNFLAVKLMSGSVNYTHFAQIYQFVPVPSLFFISHNGTPLEVVCAGVQPSNLATRIDRILEEHHKEKPVQPSTSGQNLKQQTADLIHAEASKPDPRPEGPKNSELPTYSEASKPESSKLKQAKLETAKREMLHNTASPAKAEEGESSSGPSPPKLQRTQHVEITKSGKEYDVVCEGDVCVRTLKVNPDGPGPSSANVIIAESKEGEEQPVQMDSETSLEKIEKAKEIIEARRREKAEKEKELERQKELERRATGQGVAELKQWQADQEMKQLQEERKREKLENNLARQRILEQIAQDRAERRARDMPPPVVTQTATVSHPPPKNNLAGQHIPEQIAQYRAERRARDMPPPVVTQTATESHPPPKNNLPRQHIPEQVAQDRAERGARDMPPPVVTQTATELHPPPTAGDGGTRARIQFKLPDGSSHTAHFESGGTLADVQNYVADNLQLPATNFSLWTAFPRRELTDPTATLRNLQLTPSAALLVLPRRQANTVSSPTTVSAVITFVTQMFTMYILEPSQQLYTWIYSRLFPRNRTSSPPDPPRVPTPPPPGVRRRGNVHRLGEERQGDDDNNTWNGNSTQQM